MVAATALKVMASMPHSLAYLLTELHKNLPVVSTVDRTVRHTDRMVISLAYIFPLRRKVGYTEEVKCIQVHYDSGGFF
jgi:hypothetical protein